MLWWPVRLSPLRPGEGEPLVSQVDSDAAAELTCPLVVRVRGRLGTTLLGKWRLDRLLGVGGMAAVYVGAEP